MLSIQDDMPFLRLGLALSIDNLKDLIKSYLHSLIEHGIPSNISPFLWFHMLQQPTIIISMKWLMWYLCWVSIIISWIFKSVFHSRPMLHQNPWPNGQENSRCILSSISSALHKTHLVESRCILFLVRSSHVFILSCSISEQKNLCFGRQHDFHIHLKVASASSFLNKKL
mgnify:CR=1 FL=1